MSQLTELTYSTPGNSRKFAITSILAALLVTVCTVWFLPLLDSIFTTEDIKRELSKIKKVEIKEPPQIKQIYQETSKSEVKTAKPKLASKSKTVKPKLDLNVKLSLESLQFTSDNSLQFAVNPSTEADFSGEGLGTLVFDLSEVDTPPRAISKMVPIYPYRAKRKRIEGFVTLHVIISDTGTVSDVKVIAAKPSGYFEKAAINSIRKWKFRPGQVNGKNVAVKREQTIKFSLTN